MRLPFYFYVDENAPMGAERTAFVQPDGCFAAIRTNFHGNWSPIGAMPPEVTTVTSGGKSTLILFFFDNFSSLFSKLNYESLLKLAVDGIEEK